MFLSFGPLLNALIRFSVKAQPGVDKTIDGFSEFAFTIDAIQDPTARQKLRALAKRIVASRSTPTRIVGFEVHGHADVDLRVPQGAAREQTENEVSRDRAENAKEVLLQLIEEEGGKPIIAGIRANAEARSFGSRFTKFKPAKTESEMRQNRRVEIFLRVFEQPPPRPTPPTPKAPPKPETGTNWRVQILSGTVTTVNLPPPLDSLVGANLSLKIEITDRDRKQKATFGASARAVVLPGGAVGPTQAAQVVVVPKGPPRDFTTSAGVTITQFAGTLTIAQNPSAAFLSSVGGAFVFDFEALSPALTRPRAVEVEAGNTVTFQPQFSAGMAPGTGSLTVEGGPSPAP
jgi:outer membrane protein OmpA-like peptidoglycan-associated protein